MIKLNDYLYSGDTVLKILHSYSRDLKESTRESGNEIDIRHCEFLEQVTELLEHNDFLTSQSQRIREFYKFMSSEYPYLAFTFKGRIKSLVRAEEKFNGNIIEYCCSYFEKNGALPSLEMIKSRLSCFRDLIAYRIVISLPRCHVGKGIDREEQELELIYKIANQLPVFLTQRGFRVEVAGVDEEKVSKRLSATLRPYYRDYIANPSANGYQSLHITFYDKQAGCYIEVQLRTKDMDDHAEIGQANHLGYEKLQENARSRTDLVPKGVNIYFDEAMERVRLLQELDFSGIDVNMFAARDNMVMNDGCGLFRGRQILPYEHLSRFQNDLID